MATKPLTQTTGRRKEAVARARLRPGTGKHTINGRPFDAYFTTAVQRMVVTEALRVTDAEEAYDVDATIARRRRQRPGRCAAHGDRPCARRARSRAAVHAEEGRPPDARPAEEGEQEVRPEEGAQGAAVHQALIRRARRRALRHRWCARSSAHRAHHLVRPRLGRAAAEVLGTSTWIIGRDTRRAAPTSSAPSLTAWPVQGRTSVRWGRADAGAGPCRRGTSCAGGDDHRVAQPVRGQRGEALRRRRAEAATTPRSGDRGQDRRGSSRPDRPNPRRRAPWTPRRGRRRVRRMARVAVPGRLPAGLRIVLDCANGAMIDVAPSSPSGSARRSSVINASPDGRNINDECGATSPGDSLRPSWCRGADLGLAFDGDGDRVIAVDQHGQIVDGDRCWRSPRCSCATPRRWSPTRWWSR